MKNFFSTFFMVLVLLVVGSFLFLGLLLEHIWLLLMVLSLMGAGIVTAFANQQERLTALEKKLRALTGEEEPADVQFETAQEAAQETAPGEGGAEPPQAPEEERPEETP